MFAGTMCVARIDLGAIQAFHNGRIHEENSKNRTSGGYSYFAFHCGLGRRPHVLKRTGLVKEGRSSRGLFFYMYIYIYFFFLTITTLLNIEN